MFLPGVFVNGWLYGWKMGLGLRVAVSAGFGKLNKVPQEPERD